MKTYFKYICLCLLSIGIYSCENEDDDLGFEEAGANVVLLDNEISVFDKNEDLVIKLISYDQEFQSVEINRPDGNVIADATITSDTSATFNSSALGALTAGKSIDVSIVSTLSNGQVLRQRFSVEVTDAIALDSAPRTIKFMDTTATALSFSTSTFAAPIDKVSLFRKTNLDTIYMDTGKTFEIEGDEINLGEIDYEELGVGVGDTIFYRFKAQSGNLDQTVDTQVVIETQNFGSSTSTTLSKDASMAGFNLGDVEYAAAGETGEIMFIDPMGFSTMEGIDFVKADVPQEMTVTEYVSGLDLFKAEMEYEAGSKMTSVDKVSKGDVYIYKTTRKNEDNEDVIFYGTIKIGDTITVNGNNSFEFESAEGTILRR